MITRNLPVIWQKCKQQQGSENGRAPRWPKTC